MPTNQSEIPLSSASDETSGAPQKTAAALMGVQGIALLVISVFLLADIFVSADTEAGRSITLAAVVLSFAVGAGFLANALRRGLQAARVPTVLWNAFMILIGLTVGQGGGNALLVVAVVLISAATLVAGVLATVDRD